MGNLAKAQDPTEIVTPVAETDSVIRCLGQAWRCQPREMKKYKCIACCPGEAMASRPHRAAFLLLLTARLGSLGRVCRGCAPWGREGRVALSVACIGCGRDGIGWL